MTLDQHMMTATLVGTACSSDNCIDVNDSGVMGRIDRAKANMQARILCRGIDFTYVFAVLAVIASVDC